MYCQNQLQVAGYGLPVALSKLLKGSFGYKEWLAGGV